VVQRRRDVDIARAQGILPQRFRAAGDDLCHLHGVDCTVRFGRHKQDRLCAVAQQRGIW
jgi:hypothetical protein